MDKLSRRKFLQISGASVIASAAATSALQAVEKSVAADEKGVKVIPTYCDVCFWKCGALAYVRDGKLWKIEGNPLDPLSEGRLCPRGTAGVGAHYDPDRLTTPLIRESVRGEDKWVRVTWDEAFSHIADKMRKIKSRYGPESAAMFSHGVGGTFLKHTLKAYGTNNFAAPSFAQCRGPRDIGFLTTFGDVPGSPERTDIANAKCLVLIGAHLGENMHNTQVQEFAAAVGNGASIIVADPRFSVAAGKAKYYLPIKPGTDIALLLAWMNVLVTERLYDKAYVDAYGYGFEAFAAEIAQYTPEWAYPETGIEPDIIRATAREMAQFKPATLIHSGRRSAWYGDDTQRARAMALLNALLGSWGRKGGYYMPAKVNVPGYPYPAYPKASRPPVDNPNHKYPFADEAIATGIREATISGEPYPIKAWFTYAVNVLQALPNQQETIKAIQNLDLFVVTEVIPSETAGWADVVLPESVYLERHDDLQNSSFRDPFIGIRQPVVPSPANQKPNWWIAKKLAEKMGLGAYYPWKDIEEYLETRLSSGGFSYAELKEKGIIRAKRPPIYFEEGVPPAFYTPSGKIEFWSNQLKAHGFDPVPKFTRPDQPPLGYMRLLFGRSPVHSFSRTQSNRLLADMMDENEVWVNADIAERYGYKSGDYVRLQNQDGVISNKVRVKATQRIRPDCVYMVHGFGQTSKRLKSTFLKGASDAQLVTRYKVDPIMGGTGMNVNFVTLLEA